MCVHCSFVFIVLGLCLPSDNPTYLKWVETYILFVIDLLQDKNTGSRNEVFMKRSFVTSNSRLLGRYNTYMLSTILVRVMSA